MKRTLALVLAVCMMIVCFAGCSSEPKEETPRTDFTVELPEGYDETSATIYEAVLSDFATAYAAAKAETNVSKSYALEAIAEAKLMESAVMLPCSTRGGYYSISRVAPYTGDYTLWGNDSDRYHSVIVTTELITSEDRAAMKAKWAELRGTGTYLAYVKQYLTEKGYTIKDSYVTSFNSNPKTWDALATSRAADSEAIVNTYDGLVEYDSEGTMQPALAESWEVSEDGLTYTFNLRKGVKWVDSQGKEIGEVTADDFVAGLQHMMDAKGGLEYLIQGIIVGANDYIEGTITDMEKVGVKAVDTYTVAYTLEAPCSYFMTMLGYNIFAPMNRAYFEAKGGKFGQAEFEAAASGDSYTYGTDSDSIAYCGPYLVTNYTADTTIKFTYNESYYNPSVVNVKSITWNFNDGSDALKAYNDTIAGTMDGCSLNTSALEKAKTDGTFDKYNYISSTDATSYMAFYNVNRTAFANAADTTTVVSAQTIEASERTNKAMQNVHFRRAISFAADRAAYNAQAVGEDLKLTSLRNSYTPGTFVSLAEDVTVDINGTATTFKAGTYYGEIMQAQIDADGVKIKVWDPDADDGIGSGDGFDGWYNVENAKEELEAAIKELDIKITAENPIYIDLPYPSNSETYTNKAKAYKQSVEASLEGKVIVNLVECKDYDQWYYAGYYTDYGWEANYDMYDLSGWGPDYGDPATYLDTFLDDYAGYMIKCIGIY